MSKPVEFARLPISGRLGDYEVWAETDRVEVAYRADDEPVMKTVVTAIRIQFAEDASLQALSRGINTGTMRRLEGVVKRITKEALSEDEGAMGWYASKADELIDTLRAGKSEDRLADLLNASEFLKASGDHSSIATLSQRLNVPRRTLSNQLIKARQERAIHIERGQAEGLI